MAKVKNAASKFKKKPIEQYAYKGKQRANNPPVGLADGLRISRAGRNSVMSKGYDKTTGHLVPANYDSLIGTIRSLVEAARRSAARSVNTLMTATYWEIGRRIVEFEQGGRERAIYGAMLLSKLSEDLSERLGRGFSRDNLESMRLFYLAFPPDQISETLSRKSPESSRPSLSQKSETTSRISDVSVIAEVLPLSWSHALPDEKLLAREIEKTRKVLEARRRVV